MWKLGLRPRNSLKGIHKRDFHCSVTESDRQGRSERITCPESLLSFAFEHMILQSLSSRGKTQTLSKQIKKSLIDMYSEVNIHLFANVHAVLPILGVLARLFTFSVYDVAAFESGPETLVRLFTYFLLRM
jgi:hypothetical protein